MDKIKESYHSYTVGDIVFVKPEDSRVLKGKVLRFTNTEAKLPIIECEHPYKKGEMFSNAFSLNNISKTETVTVVEWKLVEVEYKYKK